MPKIMMEESAAPRGVFRTALEYLRFWLWTPTQETRTVTVLVVQTLRGAVLVRERQRLYFGRWGRFRWRRERRYVLLPEPAH